MNHLTLPGTLLFIAIIVDVYVAQLAWRRRKTQGGLVLFFLLLAVVIWSVFVLLELLTPKLQGKILCSQLAYLGSQTAPVLYLSMVFAFTSNNYRRFKRFIPYLFIPAVIAIGLAFTNQYHHLIWVSFSPYPGATGIIQYEHGPAFWVFVTGYSYLCMIAGVHMIAVSIFKRRFTCRQQVVALLISTLLPWIGNLLYVTGQSPFPGIDGGAIAFSLAGMVMALSIHRFGLLDISPIAREILFENMVDVLIVLDLKNRITDINPSGMKLLNTPYKECLGMSASHMLDHQFSELLSWAPLSMQTTEIICGKNGERIMRATLTPVKDKNDYIIGRLIVGRDITETQIMEDKLQHANQALKNQLEQIKALQETLREQTIRDPLTGLYNRRFLDDMLALQIGQARREEKPIGLVMIDLDKFKEFNDTYGHTAGDEMVKNLALILKTRTRQGDFACRYGGEEFMVVMPGATLSVAIRRAEEWRDIFEDTPVVYEGTQLWSTFSAGVAAFPVHACTPEALIKAADKGLYLAKNCGRNRIASIETDALSVPQYHEVDTNR